VGGYAYALAALGGAGVGIGISLATAQVEAWDSREYFVVGVPLLVLLTGVLGFCNREWPWRWVLAAYAAQFLVMLLRGEGGPLLFVGVLAFAILSPPSLVTTYVGAAVSAWIAARGAG